MSEYDPREEDPIEFGEVLALSQSELTDFNLLSIVAQIVEIERKLVRSDYVRVPSLHRLIQAAREVATNLGYDEESLDDAN